jgi:outer membrane protein OmpA-like peptidoglycan-associated protein
MRTRLVALLACLAAGSANAEVSLVNLHLQPGALIDFKHLVPLGGAVFKLDVAPGQGVFAIQGQVFIVGGDSDRVLASGLLLGGGLGFRLRLLNDESGYAFGTKGVQGSLLSNLFIEAHFNLLHGGFTAGADVGVGLELSVFNGLSVAPTVKMFFNGFNARFEPTLMLGLEISLGAPFNPGADTDGDKDGIPARDDLCDAEAEDKDGFEDADGCPDGDNDKDETPDEKDKCPNVAGPTTNEGCPVIPDGDGDGVPDATDKCRTEKEDQDGFEDHDGCPDPDNDKDGVPDGVDKCPLVPEDKDGFEDADGCPDLDDDGDGVTDEKDKCPTAPGPVENDGCPLDLDKDKDGILEANDQCPAEAETVNGELDDDGCPEKDSKAHLADGRIITAEALVFTPGADTFAGKSAAAVEAVAQLLTKLPGIKKLRIEAWGDATGDDRKNLALSEKRALAVQKALLAKKIAQERLEVKGLGRATVPDRRTDFAVTEGGAK